MNNEYEYDFEVTQTRAEDRFFDDEEFQYTIMRHNGFEEYEIVATGSGVTREQCISEILDYLRGMGR